jgi:hypothetical protein
MKYKQFIAGFVTCVILLSAIFITGFAEGLTVLLNPYPVTINGVEIAVEAYNINGFTFLKLADVGKAIPNTTIKFNEIDKRIEINSAGSANPTSEQITSSEGVSLMSTTIISEELKNAHPNIQLITIADNSPTNFIIRTEGWLKFIITEGNYDGFLLNQQTPGYFKNGMLYLMNANNNFIEFKAQRIVEGGN